MCNLYRMTKTKDEVAKWFDAIEALGGANFGEEVYPGYPGLVVANGEIKQMSWGFPLVMKPAGQGVNEAPQGASKEKDGPGSEVDVDDNRIREYCQ